MNAQDIARAIQGGLIQQDRLLKLDTPLGENVLLPQRTVGWSRIGRHFEFTLDVLSTNGNIKLKKLIGQPVTLWFQQADKSYQPHHGYVYSVRRLGSEGGLTGYQIRFTSWMNFLKFRHDRRIWQDKPVDEILTDVFNAHAQAKGQFSFVLSKPLEPRSYSTQYEDDWNFVHRLMEAEGLFGIWKQGEDGKSHTLTITDRLDTCEPLAPQSVQFSRYGTGSEVDALVHWSGERTLHSAVLTTRTYDYKSPSSLANPKGTSVPTVSHELPEQLEVYEYTGPYTFLKSDRGEHLSRVRMEEWESRAKRFYGTGGLRGADAGRWFELTGHPEHDRDSPERRQFAIIETRWLIENNIPGSSHHANFPHSLQGQLAEAKEGQGGSATAVAHPDGSTGVYFIEIETQRKSVPFRSPFEHRKPVMQLQTVTVTGPGGQEVYTDTMGRVTEPAGRGEKRGEGVELRTDGNAAVRGARGLLLTTHPRAGATGDAFSVDEVNLQLASAQDTAASLAQSAQSAGAQDGEQKAVASALKAQAKGIQGGGTLKQFEQPHVVLASPAGVATSTPGPIHLSSDKTTSITTGEHVSISTGGGFFASARKALRLFVAEAGMRLVAAAGDIDVKALKDSINLLAKLNVTVTATKITISAQQEVEINGGGSYTHWTAGQIKSGTSGGFEVHSASRTFVGPDSVSTPSIPALPPEKEQLHFALGALPGGAAHQYASEPYELYKGGAKIGEGVTDEFGRVVVKDHQPGTPAYQVKLVNGGQFEMKVKDALQGDPDHVDQRSNRGERMI